MYSMRYIIDLVGYDSFFKGRSYQRQYIKKIGTRLIGNKYIHSFEVKSERNDKWYNVNISNNGEQIYDFECNCEQFKKAKSCKHVAASLYQYLDCIYEYEYVDELSISHEILERYVSSKQISNVKQKLNLEIEFEFNDDDIYFKLLIGDKKLYSLTNENKLINFLEALNENEIFEFGKNFTYDPNKYYFDAIDLKIIKFASDYKKTNNYYYRVSPFSLSTREFESFINLLDNKNFKVKNYGYVKLIKNGMPTSYELKLEDDKYKLEIENYENYNFLDTNKKYLYYNEGLYILNLEDSNYLALLEKNRIDCVSFKKEDINKFSNGLFKNVKNNIIIDENITDITLPTKPDIKLYFDILTSKLICNVIFVYKDMEINYFDEVSILRDTEIEEQVINELYENGFHEDNKKMLIEDDDLIYEFIEEKLSILSEKYNVFTSKKIDNTNIIKKVSANSNFSIGQDGIMTYKFNIDGINQNELNNLFTALKTKKKYYKLKNNDVISLEQNEEIETLNNLLTDLSLSSSEINSGDVEIPKYRALYIDSLKSKKYKNIKTNNLFNEFIENFKKYQNLEINFDKNDNQTLRDYQKVGVKWLTTLYKCDCGGILADEMGLGKSIQAISFIKQILKEKNDAKILIVAPTSLIYNWQKEFEKFGSDLKFVVVAESKSKRKEILKHQDDYNIFITTYGLIRNDNDEYENVDFELCIIDEAQSIKNYQANMTKEIKKIKAKCKIALTGTPVENNVTELWSIFDFIMPGYLNSIMKFREKYNIKDVDEESIKLLKNLNYQISPFILRRKKSEVAKSLPKKLENNIYVELPKKQKMLYMKVLRDTKEEMDSIIATEGFSKSRMKVLQLLMKLRQICIDPSVMFDNYTGERIKIDQLINIVEENISNGHKILIFSSFKRVLDNVLDEFKRHNISSYMIDGSVKSKDRMNMVEAFNNDDTNCFLITLKSGGTGLNLVGADTVIHLDIWWNPQVENQATDRAHRIGQTKNVNVIKIVTKGTIEERILELQEKKKILSDNLIEGKQNSESLSSLSEKDIRKLLSYSED